MCGIIGIVDFSHKLGNIRGDISAMIAMLFHRGPDDNGIWFDQDIGIALAHRCLVAMNCFTVIRAMLLCPEFGEEPMTDLNYLISPRFILDE
ncbi:MAG: hypothetical protein ABFS56_04720 [Pseudomonadota bacterium]